MAMLSVGAGVVIGGAGVASVDSSLSNILGQLEVPDLAPHVDASIDYGSSGMLLRLRLRDSTASSCVPGFDTLRLCNTMQLDSANRLGDLVREIVLALLAAPIAIEFPSWTEFVSGVRVRRNTVVAARKAALRFHTREVDRPENYWAYDDDYGFRLRKGVSLTAALVAATQPDSSGRLYSFSCYRASEYVMLLGMAQELQHCNPKLLEKLQTLWSSQPIKSGMFHEVFLREHGSMQAPLPQRYFVPGDRVWFRNPDEASAEASGFEGSWVFYHGAGLFTNFWRSDHPYTLDAKCLEIYHWRNGLYKDAQGDERIDESKVSALVAASMRDPAETGRILALMQRYREARGTYSDLGGCMDTTREFVRCVCLGTSDIVLPTLRV